jgi:hypothetical protein
MNLNRTTYGILATLIAILAAAAFSAPVCAQGGPRVQVEDFEVTLDDVGNATFVRKVTQPAMAWGQYKQNYGGNPSLLKRDLQHVYSNMALRDIDLKNDDMNRISTLSWKADATAEYKGNGTWEAQMVKGVQAAKVGENLWQFTNTYTDGNLVMQDTYHIHLPKAARGVEQAQSETGFPVLRYTMPNPPRSPLLWLAPLAGLLGALLLGASFLVKPATARMPALLGSSSRGHTIDAGAVATGSTATPVHRTDQ